MNRFALIFLMTFVFSVSVFAQSRYIFDSRAVYKGKGYTDGLVHRGKYVIYWSFESSAIGIECFDAEGAFSSMTIIDPARNRIIALDEREKKGFSVPYKMYATNPDTNFAFDTTSFTGKQEKINQWLSAQYKYSFPDGMTAVFWLTNGLMNKNIFKILQKTNFYFMRIPFGFNGVITKYQLFNQNGQEIANLILQELSTGKYYVFDLKKYQISNPY